MRHADPGVEEAAVELDRLLEVLARHLEFLAVEVVGAHRKPAHGVRGVVFHQVVRAVVELPREAEVQQAGRVDGQNLETEGIALYGLQAQLVGGWNLVVLVQSLSPDAQNADVFLRHQHFEDVLLPHLLLRAHLRHLLHLLDLREVNLAQPLVFGGEGKRGQEVFLLGAGDELAVDEAVEGFYVGGVFLDAFLVGVDGHEFVVLGFEAVGADEGLAALHLAVAVGVVELHFEDGEALVVLLVEEEGAGGEQLEADVVAEHLVLQEERVHLFEVAVPEVALAQQVHRRDVPAQRHQLVAEKYGVRVVMHVQIVHRQLVQSPQALVPQHRRRKVLQLGEVMLGVRPVVRLEKLGEEEDPVGLGGGEDGGLSCFFAHLNLN